MNKRVLLAMAILSLFHFAFYGATNGNLSGSYKSKEEIKVISTEWFDIIYPPASAPAAEILAEKADEIYIQLGKDYGFENYFRMPVTITPAVEMFNAYFSNGLYNHIVLYDTCEISDLEVFSETFINTFKHELIHAYTFNMQDGWLKYLSTIFGDPVNPGAILNITGGLAEGATVSTESQHGEGRMNDPYALHKVRQAKIENDFPYFYDVTGARDIYPSNTFYYFNGAFSFWLQQKYGLKKYGEWWYRMLNIQNLTPVSAFKSTYKTTLKKSWNEFKNELEVPQINANPILSNQAKDFFAKDKKSYSYQNKNNFLYENMTSSDLGLYYLDDRTGSIYFIPKENVADSIVKPRKIYQSNQLQSFSVSRDGKYISLGILDSSKDTYKSTVHILNLENGSILKTGMEHTFHSAIIMNNGKYFLIATDVVSQNKTIVMYPFTENEINKADLKSSKIRINSNIHDYVQIGENRIAAIAKDGLNFGINIYDFELNLIESYKTSYNKEDSFRMRYLTYNKEDNSLYFSWARFKTLPRMGKFDLDKKEFAFQDKDISGGIYSCIPEKGNLYYVAKFQKQDRVLVMENYNETLTVRMDAVAVNDSGSESKAENNSANSDNGKHTANAKTYKPAEYYYGQVVFPYSSLVSKSYSTKNLNGEYSLPIGLTYMTSTPWDSITASISIGYGSETNSTAVEVEFTGGSDTNRFNYDMTFNSEFYSQGFKSASSVITLTSSVPVGRLGGITFGGQNMIHIGRPNLPSANGTDYEKIIEAGGTYNGETYNITHGIGSAISSDKNYYLMDITSLQLEYSHKRRVNGNRNSYAGFSITPSLYGIQKGCITEKMSDYSFQIAASLDANVYFTAFFPVKLSFHLLPISDSQANDNDTFADILNADNKKLMQFNQEVLLYNAEIQKGIYLLYCNNISISLINSVKLMYVNADYQKDNQTYFDNVINIPGYVQDIVGKEAAFADALRLRLTIGLTPNFGSTSRTGANRIFMDIGGVEYNNSFAILPTRIGVQAKW